MGTAFIKTIVKNAWENCSIFAMEPKIEQAMYCFLSGRLDKYSCLSNKRVYMLKFLTLLSSIHALIRSYMLIKVGFFKNFMQLLTTF